MNKNFSTLGKISRLFLLVLLFCVAGLANAQTFTVGNLNYSLNSDGASVTVTGHVDGTAATGELVIPESVELYGVEYPVTKIGIKAFYNCQNLTGSLVIPNSVEIIDQSAFNNCTGMTGSLLIGNSVKTIDYRAFYNCGFTGTLTIPESVTYIEEKVFYNCNFTSLEYNAINCSTDYSEWSNGEIGHWHDGLNSLTSLTIGENVQIIPNNFLRDFTSQVTHQLVIPNSVVSIGTNAFNGCSGFSGSLTIPNSVTTIGDNAFINCSGLSGTLTIGFSVANIGNTAFFGACEGFTSYVILPDTPPTLGNNAFASANYAAPVSVHCGSLEVYQNATGWNTFTNMHEFNTCLWSVVVNVEMSYGGLVTGAGTYQQGQFCTLVATPNEGYSFVNWTENGEVLSADETISFAVTSDRIIVANFIYEYAVAIGLTGMTTYQYLPGYTYYNYSLSYQIYTADEINAIGEIGKLAFFNSGNYSITRNYDIYLAHTDKTTINNSSDLIAVTTSDRVFSGRVTMTSGDWTTITFNQPFDYNGTSNLMLIVDDNTNTWISYDHGIRCRVFTSNSGNYQAAFIYGNSNYDPTNPTYSSCTTYKNQVIFGFTSEPSYIVSATVNPAESGWVTGNGTYQFGESCTVTATANEGYAFLNWTENGEVVSTNAAYTFTVESGRALVANFRSIANHWTPESSGYSDNMGLTGIIQIDGVVQSTEALEVGAFCGTECRGAQKASFFPPTNSYIVVLTIYGNSGDNITFKLYDHDSEQELELISPSTVVFNTDGYGTPMAPYVLNFTSTVTIAATVTPAGAGTVTGTGEYFPGDNCTLTATANAGYQFKNWTLGGVEVSTNSTYAFTVDEAAEYVASFQYAHTRALVSGWNWYSTYIELNGTNGLEMLENSMGAAGIRIQGRNGYTERYDYQGTSTWYGTLTSIANEQMYKVRTNAVCNAVMIGDAALAANHPITINKGWNWIGYPVNQSVSVSAAMGGFTPEADDIIKGRNGYSTYISYPGYTMWYGTLNTMEPGNGYMYKSNSNTAKSLVFQVGAKADVVANITPENNVFVPNDAEFADNMTVTAVVDIEGEELRSESYELSAFVNDECRGSVKLMYVEPLDRYVAFLTVFGEDAESIRFVLTDGNETRISDNTMAYSPDAIVGTLSKPATIQFGSASTSDDVLIYPNPSSDVFNVSCEGIRRVEVMNAFGQVVSSKETNSGKVQIDLSDKAAGTYVLRIYTDNGVEMRKIIKNK